MVEVLLLKAFLDFKSSFYLYSFIQHDRDYFNLGSDACMVFETLDPKEQYFVSRFALAEGKGDLRCAACNIAVKPFELLIEFFWASIWQKGLEDAYRQQFGLEELEQGFLQPH